MTPFVRNLPLPDYAWEWAEEDPDSWQDQDIPVNYWGETDEDGDEPLDR